MNDYATNARVRWCSANAEGWSGDGAGTVMEFQAKRPFFGEKHQPGPAYHIRLDGEKQHAVWVAPDDLMPLLVS